jgi:cyclophilin family peptidyl-prolyl cis-trans isomerase
MDVVDKISAVETDRRDKPLKDVVILSMDVEE